MKDLRFITEETVITKMQDHYYAQIEEIVMDQILDIIDDYVTEVLRDLFMQYNNNKKSFKGE